MQSSEASPREAYIPYLIAAAEGDERLVGLLQYGSACKGTSDRYSDCDVILVTRDEPSARSLAAAWRAWIATTGTVRLAYLGMVGAPWAVISTERGLLRVDLTIMSLDRVLREVLADLPESPRSVAEMVLLDATGGTLHNAVTATLDRASQPPDVAEAFERMGGDLWYFTHRLWVCLQRGEVFFARRNHQILTDKLAGLLRIEAGATEGFALGEPTRNLEHVLSPERLAAFDACYDIRDADSIRASTGRLIALGADVSRVLSQRHDWPWPQALADDLAALFADRRP